MANYLPKGFRDYVSARADALRGAADRIGDVFALWGYRRFLPSGVEDAETLAAGADGKLLQESFRFADRTGELLVLRPDMTLQAARVMAGELSGVPAPLRLFYADPVFRNLPEGRGELREIWQAGIELAGAQGPEADAEVIAVALEALAAVGVADAQVDLGHAAFVRNFLTAHELTGQGAADVAAALERKDTRRLDELKSAGVISAEARADALKLVGAFGLDAAAVDRLGLTFLSAAAAELREIEAVLRAYGLRNRVTVDPGEVRGLEYYTGFFFHVYGAAARRPLAGGGRYDGLVGRYGRELPAVGCAIDLAAAAAGYAPAAPRRVHIVNLRATRDDALQLARALREKGVAVSRDIVKRPWEESQAFAQTAGIDALVVVEADGGYRWIELRAGVTERHDTQARLMARVTQ